ncbi:Methyltransferase [Seminavis robusta]|uniref:Methyltransferase n=1 Tax=Seminavis robusta TaxID=568900 RepID=A0A9N8DPU3_9STRA|nr:Methyltransferase [Seminavis robusta]|eukprot:Sro285_g108080.1 Methyltransferase (259) ;mRNA; f:9751-10527
MSALEKRNFQADWQAFTADSIPTKTKVDALEAFLKENPPLLQNPGSSQDPPYRRLVDLGCGNGTLSAEMASKGYTVLGLDINSDAIQTAQQKYTAEKDATANNHLSFQVADIAGASSLKPDLTSSNFHLVVCQLVISVIGGVEERQRLLRNAWDLLVPNGFLYLSASGISDTINEEYAKLYEQDSPVIGEAYTYFSRDSKQDNKILYQTHHFSAVELHALLEEAGFVTIVIDTVKEQSSRRPDQAAYFHYVTGQKKPK